MTNLTVRLGGNEYPCELVNWQQWPLIHIDHVEKVSGMGRQDRCLVKLLTNAEFVDSVRLALVWYPKNGEIDVHVTRLTVSVT